MATFANQVSNISALASKFDRLLEVRDSDEAVCRSRIEEKRKRTHLFFSSQIDRIGNVEKDFLAATESILPSSRESKTITELAELCRLSQVATREKLEELLLQLEDEGYAVSSPGRKSRQGVETKRTVSKASPSRRRMQTQTRTSGKKLMVPTSSSSSLISEKGILPKDEANFQTSLPLVANIGGPLESVLEADYETDGLLTPRSRLESPSLLSTRRGSFVFVSEECEGGDDLGNITLSSMNEKVKNRRKSSPYPLPSPDTPPTIDNLSISASTNAFLQNMEHRGDGMEDKRLSNSSLRNDFSFSKEFSKEPIVHDRGSLEQRQQHLREFRDEDDMITIDTESTMTKNIDIYSPTVSGNASNEKHLSLEERSQFFARMEDILERVEETMLDETLSHSNRFSNGANTIKAVPEVSTQKNEDDQSVRTPLTLTTSTENISIQLNRGTQKTYDECESEKTESDKISVMNSFENSASAITRKEASTVRKTSSVRNENNDQNHYFSETSLQRAKYVLMDARTSLPTHTDFTIESLSTNEKDSAEDLLEKISCNDVEEDDDNLSTVTPILDRYRLDLDDDTSIGVKVVPNKRSAHRSKREVITTPKQVQLPTIAQLSPSLEYIIQQGTPERKQKESNFVSPPFLSSKDQLRGTTIDASYNENRRVYRKTPFPKRNYLNMKRDEASFDVTNKDEYLNNWTESSIVNSPESLNCVKEIFSISVPPLRPSSFEPPRVDESVVRV